MKFIYGRAKNDPEKTITPALCYCAQGVVGVVVLGWWDWYVGFMWIKGYKGGDAL